MEEQWIIDRGQLRDLLLERPNLCYRELAQIVGRSLNWVKKWAPRLRRFPNDDCVLQRQASPRTYTRPSRNSLVVRKILDIRDHPPDGLRRVPGPKAILYYLHKDQDLQAADVPIPRSTRTVWQVLVDHQRIVRPIRCQHTPLPLAAPMQHWQCDFKDATTAKPPDSRKRSHQVEILNVIDTGTSIALDSLVRTDFNAETAMLSLANTLLIHGLPTSLTFDRDARFVGSPHARDFPSALVRFLLCLGIRPQICPPQRPDKNAYVERFHLSLEYEALQIDRPATAPQTQDCVGRYREHYNHQRPNQARSCDNQPPVWLLLSCPGCPDCPQESILTLG